MSEQTTAVYRHRPNPRDIKATQMRVRINKDPGLSTVQVFVDEPLPNVPTGMVIAIDPGPDERAIFIPHHSHPFADATGSTPLYPHELVEAVSLYAASKIDQSAAIERITATLTRYSQQTNRAPRHESAN